ADGELTEVRNFFCELGLRLELARERDELTGRLKEQSNIIGSFQHSLRSSLPMRFFFIWSREGLGGIAHHAIAKLSAMSRQLSVGRRHYRTERDNRQMNVRPIAFYLPQFHRNPENDNWTRVWDGLDKDILIEQSYSEEDDRQHIRWLANAFRDKRYIKVGDRPLFLVYRARSIPDPVKTTSVWREEARKLGFKELYL